MKKRTSQLVCWCISASLAASAGMAYSATIEDVLTATTASEQTIKVQSSAGSSAPCYAPSLGLCSGEEDRYEAPPRDYRIVAEDGDQGPVPLCVIWTGQVQIQADDGAQVQAAAGGGPVTADANTGEATTEKSFVLLNNDPSTRVEFGKVTSSSGDPTSQPLQPVTIEKPLTAQIGDTVTVDLSTAAAVAPLQDGSTGLATASSQFTLRIGPCAEPPTSVPTLSEWGIIITTLLLATTGYFHAQRRRSSRN